jgi:N4-gp56 family major capsid protein
MSSSTDFPVNDPLAVKTWSRILSVQALQATDIAPLIGANENSVIQLKSETQKGPGDQITYGLRIQLVGAGFTENEVAEGNGESLAIYSDALIINELGHVVALKGEQTIDQQRIPFNLRSEGRDGLRDWWGKRWSLAFFNQVCGYTIQTNTKFTGLQTPTAPTTVGNRIIRQNSNTDDAALTAADSFTIDLIDKAVEQAKSPPLDANGNNTIPKIRPIKIEGMECYLVYLHPYQVTSLRTNTSNGQWQDITKWAYMGNPDARKNPIFSGALGYYNNCILRDAYDITNGVSNAGVALPNVKRGVLLGAQACAMAFGQKNSPGKLRWNEETFDHGRRIEISAWSIHGMKKMRFGTPAGTMDFGTVVISTWAQAHT